MITEKELIELRSIFAGNFEYFAKDCLNIRNKDGVLQPFVMNKAQKYIHERIEEQRKRTGKVRAIILKGRQQGCSTYVEGRYYWRVTHTPGSRAFILTHSGATTDALFEMTKRFWETCHELFRPEADTKNRKELTFGGSLQSGYKIATAGEGEVGRGQTLQFFHGSEVAFWENADNHLLGALQAVPSGTSSVGTEIILESTARGVGNGFHQYWQEAEAGLSEYQAIFVPWYWQDEYRIKPGITADAYVDDEHDLAERYKLDGEQIAWRRYKIKELRSELAFRQEYPNNPAEAFVTSSDAIFIPPESVAAARRRKVSDIEVYGPRVGGLDVARFGGDRTVFLLRQGNAVLDVKRFVQLDTMQVVGQAIRLIDEWKLDKLFVDVVGLGAGVYDRLKELNYGGIVKPVSNGSKPRNDRKYTNIRGESWDGMREWFMSDHAVIPDDDEFASDMTALHYSYDSAGRLKIESKDDAKKRGIRSPDMADALALTFAFPVKNPELGKMRDMLTRIDNNDNNSLYTNVWEQYNV